MASWADLLSNPWIVAAVAGIPGVAIGVLLTWRLTRKVGLIRLTAWNNNLVSGLKSHVPGLGIVFNGTEVPSASVSRVVIWNAGNVVVRKDSLEPKDPITIELSQGLRLLDLTTLHDSDKLSGFQTTVGKGSKGGESFSVSFDHLKPKEGVALQLVHTGLGVADLHLGGSLIDYAPPAWVGTRRNWLSNLYAAVLFAFMFGLILILFLPFDTSSEQLTKVVDFAIWGVPALVLYLLRKKLGQLVFRVPAGLRPFCEGVTTKSAAK